MRVLCTCGSDQVSGAADTDGFVHYNCWECGSEWVGIAPKRMQKKPVRIPKKMSPSKLRTQIRFDTDGTYYLRVDFLTRNGWQFWRYYPGLGTGGYPSPEAVSYSFWSWLRAKYDIA